MAKHSGCVPAEQWGDWTEIETAAHLAAKTALWLVKKREQPMVDWLEYQEAAAWAEGMVWIEAAVRDNEMVEWTAVWMAHTSGHSKAVSWVSARADLMVAM